MLASLLKDFPSGTLGLVAALVLVTVVSLLLPESERKRTKIPAIYFAIAVACAALNWLIPADAPFARASEFLFWFSVFASCGRSLVLLAVDVVFGRRTKRSVPRIFRDLTQAVVYIVVMMLTLRAIGVEPGSILTTSALLTAVIGLALQDTLGNMVSGLALQMQRPFEAGDWIQFDADPRQIGQVTEVNWRATTLMTSDLVEIIVPNAVLAKAQVRNYSRPSNISRRSISVQGPYDASPHRVHAAISSALHGIPGVLDDPPAWVQTRSFADSGIEYMVWFFTDDFPSRDRIDGLVRDRIWYAMNRAKLAIPYPIRTTYVHQVSEESRLNDADRELERRDRVLRCVDFLEVLPGQSHRALASAASERLYAPGEVVIREGEVSAEMFVIERGQVAVEIVRADRTMTVAKLEAGSFFGEMGLMTGEPRKATVRALAECSLLVVGHDAFHSAIAGAPGMVEKMSELLAARQAELEVVAASKDTVIEPMNVRSQRLISQIRGFFKL